MLILYLKQTKNIILKKRILTINLIREQYINLTSEQENIMYETNSDPTANNCITI